MPNNKPTAPRVSFATKPVTPLMNEFCDWIEREVGVKLDADARRAVYLGSALRTEFQKANRTEKGAVPATKPTAKAAPKATPKAAAEPAAKVAVKPAVKPAPKVAAKPANRRRPLKDSTIATAEGVVIAEQRHVEAV